MYSMIPSVKYSVVIPIEWYTACINYPQLYYKLSLTLSFFALVFSLALSKKVCYVYSEVLPIPAKHVKEINRFYTYN